MCLVKGLSRRVIVIKSPDPKIFDQAIFIMKDDIRNKGVTQNEILREAQTIASEYLQANKQTGRFKKYSPLFFMILGALCSFLICLICFLL